MRVGGAASVESVDFGADAIGQVAQPGLGQRPREDVDRVRLSPADRAVGSIRGDPFRDVEAARAAAGRVPRDAERHRGLGALA